MSSRICGSCEERSTENPCERCGQSPLVDDRYELLEELGRGGLGTTFKALAPGGSIVALKELPYRRAQDLKTLELFEREAKVLQELDHPGIPRYIDHFVSGVGKQRALYLAQELILGRTLEDEVQRKRLTEPQLIWLMREVAKVLRYLHELEPPVIHRDLKPANLMRDESGRIRLLDFGSVRDVIKDPKLGGSTVTGTYGFMAPEQFQGLATPATDVYALGVTVLVLASKLPPQELFDPLGRERWRDRVSLSGPLCALLMTMTEPDAAARVASAPALLDALDRVARGESPFEPDLERSSLAYRVPRTVVHSPPPPRKDAVKLALVGVAGSALSYGACLLEPVLVPIAVMIGGPMAILALLGGYGVLAARGAR
ncbi:MAG: serine/threonine protein kinase [Deltaproteobacteria bacterium]|nr:serine/threonine protein kinase [Deltaproteobacteria bacterium]